MKHYVKKLSTCAESNTSSSYRRPCDTYFLLILGPNDKPGRPMLVLGTCIVCYGRQKLRSKRHVCSLKSSRHRTVKALHNRAAAVTMPTRWSRILLRSDHECECLLSSTYLVVPLDQTAG